MAPTSLCHNLEERDGRFQQYDRDLLWPGGGGLDPESQYGFYMGRAIQAGRVWTNCYYHYPAHAAFGGEKKPGIGREVHIVMLDHYLNTKNWLDRLNENPDGFF